MGAATRVRDANRVNDSFSEPGDHQTGGPPYIFEKTGGPYFETGGPFFKTYFATGDHFLNIIIFETG